MPLLKKHFGQHFLNCKKTLDKIIENICPQADETIIEIGAGGGALTEPLIESGAQIYAIEIDQDWAKQLKKRYGNQLTLINTDVLAIDWQQWEKKKVRLVGNLPYNISSPLLLDITRWSHLWKDCHFMLQQEVGNRLAACPGNSKYGRLTVSVTLSMTVTSLFDIPPTAFSPPPKVHSSFLRLIPHPPIEVPSSFDSILKLAFSYRRKMLHNALSSLKLDWKDCPINAHCRADQLSIDELITLVHWIEKTSHLLINTEKLE